MLHHEGVMKMDSDSISCDPSSEYRYAGRHFISFVCREHAKGWKSIFIIAGEEASG